MSIQCKKCGSKVLTLVHCVTERTRIPVSPNGEIMVGHDQYNGEETEVVECDHCQALHDIIFDETKEDFIVDIRLKDELVDKE